MSILGRLLPERRVADLSGLDQVQLAMHRPAISATFGPVTWDRAMRHVAVWAAANMLTELIATLPWHTYQKRNSVAVQDDPTAQLVADPDPGFVSPIGWRRQALMSLLFRGNAYGLIQARSSRGMFPTSIRLIHPDHVRVKPVDGRFIWLVDNEEIPTSELWRVAAYEIPGSPVGLSPLAYMAEVVGVGLAAQQFGAEWFTDGAVPASLLINENTVSEEVVQIAKDRWLRDAGSREPRVLGNGWKYEQLTIAPEESQFLETIQANGAQIAGFFGLRPEDLGYATGGASLTYANVEQRQIDRLVYPVLGWVRRLEDALTSQLPDPQYARANIDALVRVDTATRYRAHDVAIRSGLTSRDERRALEDLPPISDGTGGEHLWPPGRAFPLETDEE